MVDGSCCAAARCAAVETLPGNTVAVGNPVATGRVAGCLLSAHPVMHEVLLLLAHQSFVRHQHPDLLGPSNQEHPG